MLRRRNLVSWIPSGTASASSNYSLRTEKSYVDWVRRLVRFHELRHPIEMGPPEIEALLTHPVTAGNPSNISRGGRSGRIPRTPSVRAMG